MRVATRRDAARQVQVHLCHSAFVRVATALAFCMCLLYIGFATAHSCGLRQCGRQVKAWAKILCHSAFVRVATSIYDVIETINILCHSAFVRVATQGLPCLCKLFKLCHSAFVRVATKTRGCRVVLVLLCHSAFVRVATAEKQCSALRICCEKVDSFSSVGESGLALTIFPFSFAAKATYVAINDSFGRAIDRFFWCEPHRN